MDHLGWMLCVNRMQQQYNILKRIKRRLEEDLNSLQPRLINGYSHLENLNTILADEPTWYEILELCTPQDRERLVTIFSLLTNIFIIKFYRIINEEIPEEV